MTNVAEIHHPRLPRLGEHPCSICGHRLDVDLVINDGTYICRRCRMAAGPLFREAACAVCGYVRMCWRAGSGRHVCMEHMDELPPLEKYGRCTECNRLAHVQMADAAGKRYLCIDCSNGELMES